MSMSDSKDVPVKSGINVMLGVQLLWPVFCCVVTALWIDHRLSQVRVEVDARPPIAVLPVDELVLADIAKRNSADPQPSVDMVEEMGARLADAGYVVLNKSVVYASPKQFEARPGASK